MDRAHTTLLRVVTLAVLVVGMASLASAQAISSGAQPIALNATLAESLTVNLSVSAVNFTLTAGSATNAGSTNVIATTAWVLKPGRTQVVVDAYFANAAAALTDGAAGDNIPSSAFFISDNGGASAALVNTVAFGAANGGLALATVPITGANKNSSRTDNMAFNINLSGALAQLPAATYTGTLNIQAQATP